VRGAARPGGNFEVERRLYGLPTAVRAAAGSGALRIALCAEYHTLAGIGHARSRNITCAASVGELQNVK